MTLELVFSQAAAAVGPKPLVVAILYDLPNRDCHAMASNGELCCQYAPDGTCVYAAADEGCSDGLDRYRREYVDPFVDVLARYSSVPAAIIIEPDSIPNLATNAEDYKCGHASTRAAYIQGVRYAVEALHRRAPHAALSLDAAHGGWLGWPDKAYTYLNLVNQLGDAAQHLRGFATNVQTIKPWATPAPLPPSVRAGRSWDNNTVRTTPPPSAATTRAGFSTNTTPPTMNITTFSCWRRVWSDRRCAQSCRCLNS